MGRNKLVTADTILTPCLLWARSVAKNVVGKDVCVCVCVRNDIFEVFSIFYIFLWLLVGIYKFR